MVRPLVLLHGQDSSAAEWDDLIELMGADRVIARPDLPQHGTRTGEPFQLAAAIDSILDAVASSPEPPILVGRALGAHLAVAGMRSALDAEVASDAPVAAVVALGIGTETLGWVADSHRIASAITGTMRERPGTLHADALDEIARLDTRAGLRALVTPFVLANGTGDRFRFQERALVKAAKDGRLVRVAGATFGDRMSHAPRVAELIEGLS